jgi:WD40 repeat protein
MLRLHMPRTHALIATPNPAQGAVWSCVLNRSALLAATASADFSARVWDAITGDELHCLQHGHIVRGLQFGNASQRLVTGGALLEFCLFLHSCCMRAQPGSG